MSVTFRVSVRRSGRRRFVRVTVYDTVQELRLAADRYCKRVGTYVPGEFDQAHGITHSSWSIFFGPDGEEASKDFAAAAHIRLHRGALGTGVVTHEVAHAALAIYRQDCLEERGSVHDDMDQEEVVCYLIGDLSARIVNCLYRYKFYDEQAAA